MDLSGLIVEIPGQRLLVEEACSGVNSILFMTSACVFYAMWQRRGVFFLATLYALTIGCVLAGNLVRITFGAWLFFHHQIDLFAGWKHEAVGLVLSAGRLGKGGEIFVLDMGEPVRIEAMARQLIELSGFEPGREIEIRYTGLRPGEKLYEELSHNEEVTEKTEHPKIWRLKPQNGLDTNYEHLEHSIHAVIDEAAKGNTAGAKQKIKELIPEYTPWLG